VIVLDDRGNQAARLCESNLHVLSPPRRLGNSSPKTKNPLGFLAPAG
jgi:hypothetical protein